MTRDPLAPFLRSLAALGDADDERYVLTGADVDRLRALVADLTRPRAVVDLLDGAELVIEALDDPMSGRAAVVLRGPEDTWTEARAVAAWSQLSTLASEAARVALMLRHREGA